MGINIYDLGGGMGLIFLKLRKSTLSLLLGLLIFTNMSSFASALTFRVTAMNPSKFQSQTVPVQVYLPEEIQPKDVLDLGPLNLEYDATKSLYYVFHKGLTLKPGQIRVFSVEVSDVWIIPDEELDNIQERSEFLLGAFANTEYYDRMSNLSSTATDLIDEIRRTQRDETVTRSQHIGTYRINRKSFVKLKENLDEMDKILKATSGQLSPDMFDDTKFLTSSPTKTATWIVIFSLIIFSALIAIVFFFTWYRQSKITHKVISDVQKETFVGEGKEESKK